jgi:hypothetical protein
VEQPDLHVHDQQCIHAVPSVACMIRKDNVQTTMR